MQQIRYTTPYNIPVYSYYLHCLHVDCDIPGRNRSDIRLAGSNEPASGRVEILVGDQWGTICDVFWGLGDAEVVCRDLGYTGALQATGGAC